jgi:hypothetical protein
VFWWNAAARSVIGRTGASTAFDEAGDGGLALERPLCSGQEPSDSAEVVGSGGIERLKLGHLFPEVARRAKSHSGQMGDDPFNATPPSHQRLGFGRGVE